MAGLERTAGTDDDEGSPFARPGFLVAGVLVLVVVLLGAIVAVRVGRSNNASTPPATSTAPSASQASTGAPADPSASVCGLTGTAGEGTVTAAPAAAWEYDDTTAYPSSPEFGPGQRASEGYRYCFQHTPTGAVFATANALAQGASSDLGKIESWAQYFVSEGSGRSRVLAELNEPRGDNTGVRMSIVGFKVLSYDAQAARVDLALQTSGSAQTVYASAAYELAWQGGDWKLNSDAPTPFNFATVPTVAGYIPWKA